MPVISFVNMKGGVAKTTLAVNIADALVRREDATVLIVDLDPQFNATQCLVSGEEYVKRRQEGGHTVLRIFDDSPPAGMSLVAGPAPQAALKLEDIRPWQIKRGLDLLAGDLELYRLEMGAGQGREQRLKRYLEAVNARERYKYVIIDTPPTPSAWMMSSLLASDMYLVPVKPEPLSITGIDLLRGVIQRCSDNHAHPLKCLGVVLTIAEENTKTFRGAVDFLDANTQWKGTRFKYSLPKRTAVARGQKDQAMILDIDDSALKTALVNICAEFSERALKNG